LAKRWCGISDPIVALEVGGQKLTNWQALTITRDVDQLADAFSFATPADVDDALLRAALKPGLYNTARVRMDGQLLLTGRVEKPTPSGSADDRSVGVEGRSLAGSMIDTSILAEAQRMVWRDLTLARFAAILAKPYGITVGDPTGDSKLLGTNDALVGVGQPYGEMGVIRAETGASPGQMIQDQARTVRLFVCSAPDGNLQIGRLDFKGAPVASVKEGVGSFVSASGTYDGTKMFSLYRSVNAMGDWDDVAKFTENPLVAIYRPRVFVNNGNVRQGQLAAEQDRALGMTEAIGVELTVNSWTTDSGHVWDKGDTITLEAPCAWIMRPTAFVVLGVTLTLDEGGRKAVLRLALAILYSGQLPTVWPWD
jgi:prophage tail gpP-like protein